MPVSFVRNGPNPSVVAFWAAGTRYGVPLGQVKRVFPLAEIMPLPRAPAPVRGVVNIHGTVTAVVDLSRRFGEQWMRLSAEQHLITLRTPKRPLAILADALDGILHLPDTSDDGLIYVCDVDELLTAPERTQLGTALRHVRR